MPYLPAMHTPRAIEEAIAISRKLDDAVAGILPGYDLPAGDEELSNLVHDAAKVMRNLLAYHGACKHQRLVADCNANVIAAARLVHTAAVTGSRLDESISTMREALLARQEAVDAFLIARHRGEQTDITDDEG